MPKKGGKEIVVGVSGASGAGLAIAFLRLAANRPEFSRIHLIVSSTALSVARTEAGSEVADAASYLRLLDLSRAARSRIVLHANDDLAAPISSGSYPTAGMVVVPCSAGTLASIAGGISRGLLQRAADVTLKEHRPLVLAFRESPYSLIHLENMARAARAGATIMPPSPPFYIESPSAERMVDAYCHRVARVFGVPMPKEFVWTGPRQKG
jgi:4-hydroxy-3-polyprenylbenzoate decarboxylase